MYDNYENYIGFFEIGIIRELSKQGVLTKDEEEKIIKHLEHKYDIEV